MSRPPRIQPAPSSSAAETEAARHANDANRTPAIHGRLRHKVATAARRATRVLTHHTRYTRFIVLARSRTGSNMLISMLNSHPSIIARSELLARLGARSVDEILRDVFGTQPRRVTAVGFKVFYYHPMDAPGEPLWTALTAMDDLRVIHLKRTNILRTLVSRAIADRNDRWLQTSQSTTPAATEKRIELSIEALEEGFSRTRGWEKEFDRLFGQHRSIEVCYEDLTADPATQFARVLGLLEQPQQPPSWQTVKQNPEPLDKLIGNFAALKAHFAGTEWAPFFESEV